MGTLGESRDNPTPAILGNFLSIILLTEANAFPWLATHCFPFSSWESKVYPLSGARFSSRLDVDNLSCVGHLAQATCPSAFALTNSGSAGYPNVATFFVPTTKTTRSIFRFFRSDSDITRSPRTLGALEQALRGPMEAPFPKLQVRGKVPPITPTCVGVGWG